MRVINDMGSPVLIPLEYYFSSLAKSKIRRHWDRFITYLSTRHASALVDEIVKNVK